MPVEPFDLPSQGVVLRARPLDALPQGFYLPGVPPLSPLVLRGLLPVKVYGRGSREARRYFPVKVPVALDSDGAVFVYADPGHATSAALRAEIARIKQAIRGMDDALVEELGGLQSGGGRRLRGMALGAVSRRRMLRAGRRVPVTGCGRTCDIEVHVRGNAIRPVSGTTPHVVVRLSVVPRPPGRRWRAGRWRL